MDVHIDLRVVELLSSRLCHDLVGPVGAVNNGLELLEDDMGDMGPEALKLAADSGARAARALQYFRLAYGMAGSRVGGRLDELRDLADGFFDSNKVAITWPAQGIPDEAPENLGKLLLNMLLLGSEALPMGGNLAIEISVGDGGLRVKVAASGDRAALRDETRPALAEGATADDLTPRNVQAYFTCRVAERMGGAIAVDEGTAGSVSFETTLAAQSVAS
jgi:histidine phosphotransferase ChpT